MPLVMVVPKTLDEMLSRVSAFFTRKRKRQIWKTASARRREEVDFEPWADLGSSKSGLVRAMGFIVLKSSDVSTSVRPAVWGAALEEDDVIDRRTVEDLVRSLVVLRAEAPNFTAAARGSNRRECMVAESIVEIWTWALYLWYAFHRIMRELSAPRLRRWGCSRTRQESAIGLWSNDDQVSSMWGVRRRLSLSSAFSISTINEMLSPIYQDLLWASSAVGCEEESKCENNMIILPRNNISNIHKKFSSDWLFPLSHYRKSTITCMILRAMSCSVIALWLCGWKFCNSTSLSYLFLIMYQLYSAWYW